MHSDDAPDLAALGAELVAAIDGELVGWAVRSVVARGGAGLAAAARDAGEHARSVLVPRLAALLALDVDEQRTTPLAVVREAVGMLTPVLEAAGLPPVARDPYDEQAFPDDRYALVPAAFVDLGPESHEAGLRWGVGKAFVHRRRHQR